MLELKGKLALIPGASRPIGRAIARKFARNGARLLLPVFDWPESIKEMQNEFNEQGWGFTPEHLVPGMGFTSLRGMWRFVTRARRTAAGYLAKRYLPRTRIPWPEIEACKK